ncbi:radical SAM protein [Kaarinaea lacus]
MYSPFRHIPALFWKNKPIQLTFFVTRRCNARCPYCFYLESEDNGETLAVSNREDELSLEEIKKLAPSFGRLLWLAFSGGEIFLRRDLVEISQVFYATNKPSIMLFPTNGLMPDLIRQQIEQVLLKCPNSTVVIKLSIDDLHEKHDKLRNTPKSFEKTLQTYESLAPLLDKYPNFELGVNTVFCADNQHNMDHIIDYVKSMSHISTHTISMIRGSLNNAHYQLNLDYNLYNQAVDRLAKEIRDSAGSRYRFIGAGLKAAQDVIQRRLIYKTIVEQQRQIPCYAGQSNIVLTETGEIYPCEILSGSYGNIRQHNYDINRVLETAEARKGLADIKANACYCTHECNLMTNILLNPMLIPELAREYRSLNT